MGKIKTASKIVEYLNGVGIDAFKPYDILELGNVDENVNKHRLCAAYEVFGNKDTFHSMRIEGINIELYEYYTDSSFPTDKFIIEVSPITLQWE